MYFNLGEEFMITAVREQISSYGTLKFQNEALLTVDQFIELLKLYLKSTVVREGEKYYIQSQECVLAPRLHLNLVIFSWAR